MFNGTMINNSPTIIDVAGQEITTGPFTAVAYADGGLVPCTSSTIPVGIMISETDESVASGDDVTVQVKDITMWAAGGEFAKGDALACDDNGCAVKATTGKFIFGYALTACDTAGQVAKVQITKSGYEK